MCWLRDGNPSTGAYRGRWKNHIEGLVLEWHLQRNPPPVLQRGPGPSNISISKKKINFLLTTLLSAFQKTPCCDPDGACNALKRSTRFLEQKGDFEVIPPGDRSTLVLKGRPKKWCVYYSYEIRSGIQIVNESF